LGSGEPLNALRLALRAPNEAGFEGPLWIRSGPLMAIPLGTTTSAYTSVRRVITSQMGHEWKSPNLVGVARLFEFLRDRINGEEDHQKDQRKDEG